MEKAEDKEESLKPLFNDVVFSKERINKVFSIYSEKSSVSGIAFIIGSKYPAVRIIWTLVLTVALIALTCHLTLLFIEYYAFEKRTVTSLYFDVLPFPVITFCNVNPIRLSKLHRADKRLQNIVNGFNPKRILERQEAKYKSKDKYDQLRLKQPDGSWKRPPLPPKAPPLPPKGPSWTPIAPPLPQKVPPRSPKHPATTHKTHPTTPEASNTTPEASNTTPEAFPKTAEAPSVQPKVPLAPPSSKASPADTQHLRSSRSTSESDDGESKHQFDDFLDGIGLDFVVNDEETTQTGPAGIIGRAGPILTVKSPNPYKFVDKNSTASIFASIFDTFRSYFAEQSLSVREEIGHSLGDILIHCSFGGKRCQPRDFTSFSSNHYGNCYTLNLQNHNLVTRDGPLSGLDMILYLQVEDHIKGFTNSKGAQVVIHEPGTVPSPYDDGFSVSAGTHTMVGLRMHDINRLGRPYGDCVPEGQSSHMPSTVKYTRETCQKYCQFYKIYKECDCIEASFSNIVQALHSVSDTERHCKPTNKRDIECVRDTLDKIAQNYQTACDCPNPCRERRYMTSISSRQWPDEDYAAIFVNSVCQKRKGQECDALRAKYKTNLREEFVKLSIFYEDLNYQELKEVANYKFVNLISDIGGTIGLWIGLSLVSMVEMIHLLMSFVFTTCLNKWKNHFTKRSRKNKASGPLIL